VDWVAPLKLMPVFAHIGHLLEPLLFLPAFVVVLGAIAGSVRGRAEDDRNPQ
jgi:hypothetical protein